MAKSVSVRFDYQLKCPVDRVEQTVRFQAGPQALDVISCTGVSEIVQSRCAKLCPRAAEIQEFWRWATRSLSR